MFRLVEIAVRKEEPEFRSGFEKEDKIFEDYIPLPPRVLRSGDQMFTISRGRTDKTFMLKRAQGEDRLSRVKKDPDGLTLDYPFAAVKFFILDFAIPAGADKGTGALLLMNAKPNGQGQAFLLYQQAD